MIGLDILQGEGPLRVLCIGAHSDDIEIGCAGTLLHWLARRPVALTWLVCSAEGPRAAEARRSARALARRAAALDIVIGDLPDARFPSQLDRAKDLFTDVARRGPQDVVLTHRLEDRHQDHRVVAELSWQTWRDQLVLEYEIPKYEGDLGQPNLYVPLQAAQAARKLRHLMQCFGTQRSKTWFQAPNFEALMRLRGLECRAPSGLAEAFQVRKAILA